MVLARPQRSTSEIDIKHRHQRLASDIDIEHRWYGRDYGPRKRGPKNSMC